MILRFFNLTWRRAIHFRTYSFINIGGLALGLASSIAILHFVQEEFSYDDFHTLPHNVYRLNTVSERANGIQVHAAATPILAPTLMADIPEGEAAFRLRHADDVLIKLDEKQFYENRVFYADSNFFKVMSFTLAEGNPETALTEINSAVITSEFAEKYFGSQDPMNKLIGIDDLVVKVTGVTNTPPGKSHFKFDMLVSFETFTVPKGYPASLTVSSWGWTSFPTYVRLREGTTRETVEAKFPAFIAKYMNAEAASKTNYQLQPIQEVYLHSRNILERDGISTKGDYTYTMGMAAIAALILGIACFNFMNLSAALSTYRVKETGIKKTLGASRAAVFAQFIGESVVIAGMSLLLAILLLQIFVGPLENLLGASIELTWTSYLGWLPFYVCLILLIGCLGGLYPAIFLSRLRPQIALKGKNILSVGREKLSVRKAIIVFQFFITAALIATSLTIKKQMDFLFNKDLGFEKEGVVALRVPGDEFLRVYPSMRNKLSQNTSVLGVSAGRYLFDGQQGNVGITEVGSTDEDPHRINLFGIYPDFIETMGLEMLEGRSISEQFNDSASFILNEAAVKMFGWEKDVIGRKLNCLGQQGEVIGVVKDFHFSSLHSAIAPILLQTRTRLELLFVRVAPGNISGVISSLESDWREIAPQLPFDYLLLDDHISQLYEQDKRFSRLAYVFCGLSVVLACLGLYGIISFMAETRTKEIGIRKVLGASVLRITALLSRQFMIWVFIAALIALPASYYLLGRWLSAFAYKVEVSAEILLLSVLLSSLLAAATVSFKSVKAARANPVESLRNE
jgi:putative ABC transport system permease protein